jgi:carbamoyl-phosphate synthase small subunit
LRDLKKVGARITRIPYGADIEQIKKLNPEGVLISNGPGDPSVLSKTIELIQGLLKENIPLAGICLGHQLLGLAIGGRTYKMKFGHRGINHPVKDLRTGRVLITTHNHGFAVDPKSFGIPDIGSEEQDANILTKDLQNLSVLEGKSSTGVKVEVTHISLNDGTMEGMRLIDYPAFSVQYHPEASPGPHDANGFFEEFKRLIKEVR